MNRLEKRGFTVLELLVAVSVTALLAAMLFTITSQVVKTQTQSSGDLETNQVAQFILDRILFLDDFFVSSCELSKKLRKLRLQTRSWDQYHQF